MKMNTKAEAVINRLKEQGLTLATAESCTGGLIGKLLTDVPGASAVYKGGVISYVNEIKRRLLGVEQETLDVCTAVSRETAHEMARGARERLMTDCAVSVTGAVVHMPIFHPLIGMDKEEIVTVARRIGTLDTSILPYEDCCTVFTPKHPKTKPVLAQVEAEEQKLDVEGLIARAIANTEKTQIRYYEDEHKG